jgi:hypothetical protein
MDPDSEKLIYPKALKSFNSIQTSIQQFEEYLEKPDSSSVTVYYSARKHLKEGLVFYNEALKNAKRLLGPIPEYATDDFQRWRDNLLEHYHILAKSQELKDLQDELEQDEFLSKFLDADEIKYFLGLVFPSQLEGKRKLTNIKIRIMFEKLTAFIKKSQALQKQASEQHQANL